MKHKFLFLITIPFLSACDLLGGNNPAEDNPSSGISEDTKEENVDNQDEMYQALFKHSNDIRITIQATNEAWGKMKEYGDSSRSFEDKELYHPANVTIKINDKTYTYDEVGVRLKGGSFSRNTSFFHKSTGLFDDEPTHLKLSFSQTFSAGDLDYYTHTPEWTKDAKSERKDRKIGKMKKIDLKWNRNYDYTFTRESYMNYCFNDVDLAAQLTNLVKVTLISDNDSKTFTYQMNEALDKQFIKHHYGKNNTDGNLYKGAYNASGKCNFSLSGKSKIGIESNNFMPIYDLKTNDDVPDHTLLNNVITKINNNATTREEIENIINVPQVLKYMAMSWVMGNPDDFRMNDNNTFFYFNKDNKLEIITYDNDRCLGIHRDMDHSDLRQYGMLNNTHYDGSRIENNLYYRFILNGQHLIQDYQDQYIKLCKQYATEYLSKSKFDAFTAEFANAPHTDSTYKGDGNTSFASYATEKLKLINQ